MSPNPNSGGSFARHSNSSGSDRPLPSRKWREEQDDDYPAARAPTTPKLTTEFDAASIVNRDYDDDGDAANFDMLALLNQYEQTLNEIQEGQILQGTVVEVRENEVLLKELVQDAAGDWVQRESTLRLQEGGSK